MSRLKEYQTQWSWTDKNFGGSGGFSGQTAIWDGAEMTVYASAAAASKAAYMQRGVNAAPTLRNISHALQAANAARYAAPMGGFIGVMAMIGIGLATESVINTSDRDWETCCCC